MIDRLRRPAERAPRQARAVRAACTRAAKVAERRWTSAHVAGMTSHPAAASNAHRSWSRRHWHEIGAVLVALVLDGHAVLGPRHVDVRDPPGGHTRDRVLELGTRQPVRRSAGVARRVSGGLSARGSAAVDGRDEAASTARPWTASGVLEQVVGLELADARQGVEGDDPLDEAQAAHEVERRPDRRRHPEAVDDGRSRRRAVRPGARATPSGCGCDGGRRRGPPERVGARSRRRGSRPPRSRRPPRRPPAGRRHGRAPRGRRPRAWRRGSHGTGAGSAGPRGIPATARPRRGCGRAVRCPHGVGGSPPRSVPSRREGHVPHDRGP